MGSNYVRIQSHAGTAQSQCDRVDDVNYDIALSDVVRLLFRHFRARKRVWCGAAWT